MSVARLVALLLALFMSAGTFAQESQPAATSSASASGNTTVVQSDAPPPVPHLPVRSILADAHAKLNKAAPAGASASIGDRRTEAEELARRINDALRRMAADGSVTSTVPGSEPMPAATNTPASPIPSVVAPTSNAANESHATDLPSRAVPSAKQPEEPTLSEVLAMLNRRLELVEQRLAELEGTAPHE